MPFHLKNLSFSKNILKLKDDNYLLPKERKTNSCVNEKHDDRNSKSSNCCHRTGSKMQKEPNESDTNRFFRPQGANNPKRSAKSVNFKSMTRQTCFSCGIPGHIARNRTRVQTKHHHHQRHQNVMPIESAPKYFKNNPKRLKQRAKLKVKPTDRD